MAQEDIQHNSVTCSIIYMTLFPIDFYAARKNDSIYGFFSPSSLYWQVLQNISVYEKELWRTQHAVSVSNSSGLRHLLSNDGDRKKHFTYGCQHVIEKWLEVSSWFPWKQQMMGGEETVSNIYILCELNLSSGMLYLDQF